MHPNRRFPNRDPQTPSIKPPKPAVDDQLRPIDEFRAIGRGIQCHLARQPIMPCR